ncbi:MAG: sugar phosphate isomerase/epimerase [Verrucomicrobia bacterium]|nr:sugar phosphate isomerase/epimerase [Verrucomicrobiota bacterium]
MNEHAFLSRRDFLARAALAGAAAAAWPRFASAAPSGGKFAPLIPVFSKLYQELKLDFDQAAELTAEAGLDGVDCPVRPKGEIEPERAADEIPRYAEALRKRKLDMLLITTGINSVASPHAETVLRTAKKLGISYYRLGFSTNTKQKLAGTSLPEIKAQLRELAALNKELGLTGVIQNHSPSGKSTYVGGDLHEMYEIVKDFNPDQIGVAFDLCHALIVHGDDWGARFDQLKPHIKVAYVKDVKRPRDLTPFGEGEFKNTDYFKRLKQMNLTAPLSMHIEYKWCPEGQEKTRAAMLKMLQQNLRVLKDWLAAA